MKRGTIILTPFPFTDLSKNKVRPALIVSSNNRKDNDVIIAFISSVVEPDNLSQTYILLDSKDIIFKETGLKTISVIRIEKLATIDKKIILGELESIDKQFMNRIDENLKIVLDLI